MKGRSSTLNAASLRHRFLAARMTSQVIRFARNDRVWTVLFGTSKLVPFPFVPFRRTKMFCIPDLPPKKAAG